MKRRARTAIAAALALTAAGTCLPQLLPHGRPSWAAAPTATVERPAVDGIAWESAGAARAAPGPVAPMPAAGTPRSAPPTESRLADSLEASLEELARLGAPPARPQTAGAVADPGAERTGGWMSSDGGSRLDRYCRRADLRGVVSREGVAGRPAVSVANLGGRLVVEGDRVDGDVDVLEIGPGFVVLGHGGQRRTLVVEGATGPEGEREP